ncbi:DUF3391 domain-containing protein [Rhizobium sp. VS19-DR104.2]|nr:MULTISPECIES: DUF3391 domain-containing protein [unclassified Rhizobium]MBZ5788268.1 DUF3391 domain-containing protein [Rhizobium sp. VS19-DR121]MBZ5763631.1 DUF3391 domain-containing protein [Rhizobium sp. VS19-DR96]MBZ5777136.1 DUF3391 domain-containing protein [Rhizobium sp. VS19-DRK62.2]MBZ5805710.1 DUF3391 domain-containing protein [Rhizobium sp. VS19-DR181]MBZ5821584.1 DUF3391 domain-containing protein [Rhizobium sp. VS19-DR183]
MLKHIGEDQLSIGMSIETLEGSWLGTPLTARR